MNHVRRSWILAFGLPASLAMMMLVIGCHNRFDTYVENRSESPVTVSIDGHDVFDVEDCSAVFWDGVTARAGLRPWVQVRDVQGKLILDEHIRAIQTYGPADRLDVYVPAGKGGDTCPAAVEDRFTLRLRNQTRQRISVALRGDELGWVEPLTWADFGPLEGNWREARDIELHSEDGVDRLAEGELEVTFHMVSRLGEVPEVTRWVHERDY